MSAKELSLDERTAAVSERLEQVRKRLAATPSGEPGATLPAGVTNEEWTEAQQLLSGLETRYQKHLDSLRGLEQVRQSQQDLRQESESWQGFKEPPPYPVSLVDGLWNHVRAKDREIQVIRIEHDLLESMIEGARVRLKTTSQALRQAAEQLETGGEPAQVVRARWLRDLSELRNWHAEAVVAAFESERQLKAETLVFRLSERELLERKAVTALRASPLSAEDRDAKLAALAAEQRELQTETERAVKAEQQAQQELQTARTRLRELRERSSPALPEEAQGQARDIARTQQELEARKAESDVAASVVKILRVLYQANTMQQQMWHQRYQIEHGRTSNAIEDAVANLQHVLELINQLRAYLLSELDLMQRRIDEQQQRLALWQGAETDKEVAEQELRAYVRGETMLRRGLAKVNESEALVSNWLQAMRLQREAETLGERLNRVWGELTDIAIRFWNFELVAVEDKMVLEGREIVVKRSVTLGKIIQMLVILVVGMWLTAYLAAHGRRMMLKRFPGKETRALLLYRLFSLIAGLSLIVFALITVNIPLTVFAFLGGALAIAAGFGAQNILNNFISGLILLLERPIKVGDIVEVEGIRGEIANIGGRCCQVRRFDGIDMLIPNSSFLEKNVTNWTLSDQQLRFTIALRAAYGSTVREVIGLIRRAVEEHSKVLRHPAPEIFMQNFGDSAMEFRLDFWVDISVEPNWPRVLSDLRVRIEELFREAGILIAFPQRDVHLHSAQPLKIHMVTTEDWSARPAPAKISSTAG